MRGRDIPYTARQLAWIKRRRKWPRRALHAAFIRKFRRRDVSLLNFEALCCRKGWLTGRDGCFPKGHVPANKGKKMPYNKNSARTQFKKGHVSARAHPIGHERLTKDGYVEIKVTEKNPHTGGATRYVLKHRRLWERKHGPVPDGMALKAKGDRLDTDPSNWELVPRALLPRLNGRYGRCYDDAPAALKPAIMATAKLAQRLGERKRAA